ncbi:MAG: FGGY family carbohydrate kinase [Candidatus Poribacteria bacterium]|nr:FGGY family carbohydrate kinase [Candidatus Poribacteria bacterium]
MARYIGLDLGTTSITGLILDTESKQVLIKKSVANEAEITSPADRVKGRSEWDIDRMIQLAFHLLSTLVEEAGDTSIAGLGVTGQMHGMVLLNTMGKPCLPFIGWQDQRCHERLPDGQTYLSRMINLGGDGFAETGCRPATGYMASTLFWLAQNDLLPDNVLACFAPDYLVSRLCEQRPVTDATNAASAGIFNPIRSGWDGALVESLGLQLAHLPDVRPSCEKAGEVTKAVSRQTGLPSGLPVTVACGDNQASFAGSVADYGQSVLINIGTGGQISAFLEEPLLTDALDLRPFVQSGFLLVGAGLCGGRSYRALRDFIRQVGEEVFGLSAMPDIYECLNRLAAAVAPGADGLRCEPIFSGSRREPERRGVWSGMSEKNFTVGHMARALLEGLAEQFRLFYNEMLELGIRPRSRLIGSGNGIRKNALLRQILSAAFSVPLEVAGHTEEAAMGAALGAAVAEGEFENIQAASRHFIRYEVESV